jgi:hypothetical protein
MNNVHVRRFAAPIEQVRAWIEACWSGGDRDCFPRDVIPTWRRNPDGVDPMALVPGETLAGHGPFRFRLRAWDGRSWKVDLVGGTAGWHGFELVPDGDGCRVTHTLWLAPSPSAWLRWMVVRPAHDWAVEAMFDRMAQALRTGAVPAVTERPVPKLAAVGLWVARRSQRRRHAQRGSRMVAAS